MEEDDVLAQMIATLKVAKWWKEKLGKLARMVQGSGSLLVLLTGATASTYFLDKLDKIGEPGVTQLMAAGLILSLLLVYMAFRVRSYRASYRRVMASQVYLRYMSEHLNASVSRRAMRLRDPAASQESPDAAAQRQVMALQQNVRHVLDQAALTMRRITRQPCTASIVMPYHTQDQGNHFRTIFYCSDTDPERLKTRKPKQNGYVVVAYANNDVLIVGDYQREAAKGTLIGSNYRQDNWRWYRSAIFRVIANQETRFGVLCIDSPTPEVFFEDHANIVTMFAETLALVYLLHEYDILSVDELT